MKPPINVARPTPEKYREFAEHWDGQAAEPG